MLQLNSDVKSRRDLLNESGQTWEGGWYRGRLFLGYTLKQPLKDTYREASLHREKKVLACVCMKDLIILVRPWAQMGPPFYPKNHQTPPPQRIVFNALCASNFSPSFSNVERKNDGIRRLIRSLSLHKRIVIFACDSHQMAITKKQHYISIQTTPSRDLRRRSRPLLPQATSPVL